MMLLSILFPCLLASVNALNVVEMDLYTTNVETDIYLVNVTAGNPPQTMQLLFGTGRTSDVWVIKKDATVCASNSACEWGTFDSNTSSTFKEILSGGFDEKFGSASTESATGDFFTDDLTFGNVTIKSLQMGLASEAPFSAGTMGLGFDTDEGSESEYPTLLDDMVSQGLINTEAFSLWLNSSGTSGVYAWDKLYGPAAGSVLFGGIDQSKYTGPLISTPMVYGNKSSTFMDSSDQTSTNMTSVNTFAIEITSLTTTAGNQMADAAPVSYSLIIAEGVSTQILPEALLTPLFNAIGAVYDKDSGSVGINCTALDSTATVSYQFGGSSGPKITIPLNQMVQNDENGKCELLIEPVSEPPYYLGFTFLNATYVVYDLHNKAIALANRNFDGGDSDIIEIPVSGLALGWDGSTTSTPASASGSPTSSSASASASAHAKTSSSGSTAVHSAFLISAISMMTISVGCGWFSLLRLAC